MDDPFVLLVDDTNNQLATRAIVPFPDLGHPVGRISSDDGRVDVIGRGVIGRMFEEIGTSETVACDDVVERFRVDLGGNPG